MAGKLLPVALFAALLIPGAARVAAQPPVQADPPGQSERVRQGVRHFERAFYELTPHKRDREASAEFDRAIAQFELEVSRQPASAVAHAYLGRIFSLRKDFRRSAAHYDRLSEIEPANVDACVFAALAYGELGDAARARARLEAAKQRTSDPDVQARLAEYLAKLDKLNR